MANDDILRRDGVLARITGFDEGRTAYYAVMPNGHSTQLTFPSQEIFDIGDVLLVGKDFYTKVPPSVWPVKPRNPPCAGGLRGHRDLGWSGIAGR